MKCSKILLIWWKFHKWVLLCYRIAFASDSDRREEINENHSNSKMLLSCVWEWRASQVHEKLDVQNAAIPVTVCAKCLRIFSSKTFELFSCKFRANTMRILLPEGSTIKIGQKKCFEKKCMLSMKLNNPRLVSCLRTLFINFFHCVLLFSQF